jgi:hypothetical protein
MNAHASRLRAGLSRGLPLALALLSATVAPPPAAWPQIGAGGAAAGGDYGTEHLSLSKTGTFEVWQDTTRLGTEFYRVYASPKGDSLIAVSNVRYDLRDRGGRLAYEKKTLEITRTLDAFPLLLQSEETVGGQDRSVSITFREGNAIVFREAGGGGQADVIAVPPGRLHILDPNVYEHVESLVADFWTRGIAARTQNVIMTPRDTVLQIRLTRGPQETVVGPEGRKVKATRVDVFDELTLIKTWLDDQGLMIRLEAPAQKLRVVRLAPGKSEAEAATGAVRRGAATKGTAPPK